MSLLPYLFDDSRYFRPSTLLDQHFGAVLDPEDFLQPFRVAGYLNRSPAGYLRNWVPSAARQDSGSVVSIEGKHEEKPDEHGHIYRHFVRRYVLPKGCDIGRVESKLSSDGVLTITAPKIEDKAIEEKHVPIAQTGQPRSSEKEKTTAYTKPKY